MSKSITKDIFFLTVLVIVSLLLVVDLWLNPGRELTFDGVIHMVTIAQFAQALLDHNLPVMWANNFANYGFPLSLFAHQVTAYLGGGLVLLTHNVVLSYNLLYVLGSVSASIAMYFFLRVFFSEAPAFAGSFLFTFAPYRILNVYARGALPEFFSSFFVPIILSCAVLYIRKKWWWCAPLFILSVALLALSHPMMLVVDTTVILPFILFACLEKYGTDVKKLWAPLLQFGIFFALGILLCGYYLLPLQGEIKYFYQGNSDNHLAPNSYLGFNNFFTNEYWPYFYENQTGMRGQFFQIGIIETVVVVIGIVYAAMLFFKHKKITWLHGWLAIGATSLFFTLPVAAIFYQHFSFLSDLQFPWRFMSAFIFVPPFALAYILSHVRYQTAFAGIFVLLICIFRFPQLYGKNFLDYPQQRYFFTKYNLHSTNLNTIWTGETEKYPVKLQKADVIEGDGKILSANIHNPWREYHVDAKTSVRIVDYTFYFPGWKVLIDGQNTPIQFQDPNYRGVITYIVPSGIHDIKVEFEDTKIRKISKIISLACVGILIGFTIFSYGRQRVRRLHPAT